MNSKHQINLTRYYQIDSNFVDNHDDLFRLLFDCCYDDTHLHSQRHNVCLNVRRHVHDDVRFDQHLILDGIDRLDNLIFIKIK